MRTARALLAAGALLAGEAAADEALSARAEEVMRRSFSTATAEEWRTRLEQDEVNALCSASRNAPGPEAAARILELSRATLRLPADGRLVGDWREGEKLASIGTGGHIGRVQPDRPGTRRGGNCYACHELAAREVSAGNLGPSLRAYGRRMGNSPEMARRVYEKIWNAQALFPCSPMPRFGASGWLTPEEVAHATAFLLDPESPVNQ